MLNNIKSLYFIEKIFSNIDEKIKLKIIKYNKSLQNTLCINIINYKIFNRNYIIYDSNGIGKEYFGYDSYLLYEGEYLNGERNGKGKEYDSFDYIKHIKYEGGYKNGKRNGKGREYEPNGNIRFEGEYLNGKKNGKGKEYLEGDLIFEENI